MRRFFAPPERFQEDQVSLDAEETHHLARVVRLGVGAQVEVGDGQGRVVEAQVLDLSGPEARLKVVRHLPGLPESPLAVTLAVGLAKGEALEEVVRRATEMGVSRLTPFVCQRSERPTPGRGLRRLERWRRLAQESLKSCRRAVLPVIDPVQGLADVLAGPEELKIMFWEEQEAGGLAALLARPRPAGVRLLIGPEGGFSAGEAAQAKEAGFLVASLGPRALKVPTAAMTALALVQFAWGDLA